MLRRGASKQTLATEDRNFRLQLAVSQRVIMIDLGKVPAHEILNLL
jgi:hypothetical protein